MSNLESIISGPVIQPVNIEPPVLDAIIIPEDNTQPVLELSSETSINDAKGLDDISIKTSTEIPTPVTNTNIINEKPVIAVVEPVKDLTKLTGRARSLANLIPNRKGEVRNPKGITGVKIKVELSRRLKRQHAEKIADALIKGAIAGDDKKLTLLLKLTGDLVEGPQLQVNNVNAYDGMAGKVQEYLREKAKTSANTIEVIANNTNNPL